MSDGRPLRTMNVDCLQTGRRQSHIRRTTSDNVIRISAPTSCPAALKFPSLTRAPSYLSEEEPGRLI